MSNEFKVKVGLITPYAALTALTGTAPLTVTSTTPVANLCIGGSAGSLISPSTTGLAQLSGMGAGTTRIKTVRDANDTLLELGGSYSPSGAWTFASDATFHGVKIGMGSGAVASNTAIGQGALNTNSTGYYQTAIGYCALQYNTTGFQNTAVGYNTLQNNTIGSDNIGIGYQSAKNSTSNVATLGTITGGSGYTNGTYNGVNLTLLSGSTALVYPVANITVSGGAVTIVSIAIPGSGFQDTTTILTCPAASIGGTGSGWSVPVTSLATATGNTSIGSQSLFSNYAGSGNTSIGYQALYNSNTGSQNVSVGLQSLYNLSSGTYNTVVGYYTGLGITTGSGNTIIGAHVGGLASGLTNNIILANGTGAIKAQHDGTDWTLTGKVNVASQIVSTLATGTAPFVVASTTPVANLSIGGNAATVTTIPTLGGEVSNSGNTVTLSNSAVIGKTLTGFTSGGGTISSADTILSAIQKLNGNISVSGSILGGNSTTLLGSIPYQSDINLTSLLAPNVTTTKLFLSQVGNGTYGAAPVWSAVAKADVGLGSVENTALSTWAGTTNLVTMGNITPLSVVVGTLGFTPTNRLASFQSSVTTYNQVLVQNTNAGTGASTDIALNNNLGTDSTYYCNIGINSSAFTGSGSFTLPNASYITATSGDLAIGTTTANAIRFVVNSGATDAGGFSSSGVFSLATALAGSSGGTGNAYTTFTGPTAARSYALPDASSTLLYSGGALGTPSSGTLTNCTFPTLNQSTTGSANSLKSPSTTGLVTIGGMTAGVTRAKTVRDADDTLLELGGSYTPSGTWTFSNSISSTCTYSAALGAGNIYLNSATGNRIDFNTNGVAAPAFTTRSAGTKILLYSSIDASHSDFAIGIESGALWYSIPLAISTQYHKWYAGTTNVMQLSGTGVLTLANGTAASPTITSTTGGAGTGIWYPAANTIAISNNGVESLRADSAGNVGIGLTPSGTYKLEVNGNFAATTKSFKINHPTKENFTLEYGSLESPYHGVRLTGKSTVLAEFSGTVKVELPEYISRLINHNVENVNIQLTSIRSRYNLWVEDIDIANNYFIVMSDSPCDHHDFYWSFTGVRTDVNALITEYQNVN